MLIFFFDICGLVHHKFVPKEQTINKEYCLTVLKRLRVKICQRRPDLWKKNSWIIHDDYAPPHKATVVTEFNAKNATNTIDQPPYLTWDEKKDIRFKKTNLAFSHEKISWKMPYRMSYVTSRQDQ